MKYKFNKIVLALLLVTTFVGCYKDKGNYDYLDDPNIVVRIAGATRGTLESIKTKPLEWTVIVADKDTDEEKNYNDYTYEWAEDNQFKNIVSTNRKYVRDFKSLESGKIYVKVTNKKIQTVDFLEFDYAITSTYSGEGWLILSEKDGKAMVSMIRIQNNFSSTENIRVYHNVYSSVNGDEMRGKPMAIREHWGSIDTYGNMMFLTDLEGYDTYPDKYERDIYLNEAILSGSNLSGRYRNIVFMNNGTDIIEDKDGKLYTRIREDPNLVHVNYFITEPVTYENPVTGEDEILEDCKVLFAPMYGFKFMLIYDNKYKRFLAMTDKGTWYPGKGEDHPDYDFSLVNAGRVWQLPAYPTDISVEEKPKEKSAPMQSVPDNFIPLDNLNGYNVVSVSRFYTDYEVYGCSVILEKDGKYYIQEFKVKYHSNEERFIVTSPVFKHISGLDGKKPNCFFKIPNLTQEIFVSIGEKLYVTNTADGLLYDYYTFDSKIVKIHAASEAEYTGVALENGKFYIINGDQPKTLDDSKKIRLELPEHNFGRIVDFHRRVGLGYHFY